MWLFKDKIQIIFATLLLVSCAEKEITIPPLEVPTTGKKVLVEDLTGVRCPNCPSANARLEAIQSIYGDNLVIVGIHGDLLTRPLPESSQDFRNPAASAIEASYAPLIGKPSAVINRKVHPEFSLITNPLQDQWQPIIERELQLPQEFVIEADIINENEGYTIYIGVVPLIDYNTSIFIHIMIIENGIIDAQEDVDRIVYDYTHDHVLRDLITPLEGSIIGQEFSDQEVVNASYFLPEEMIDDLWIKDGLELVIFISNEMGEVLEVITEDLIQ